MINALSLCKGTTISNAPAANRNGVLHSFEPTTRVGGAVLLRAPVRGCVSSGFGPRRGGASSLHKGVDLYTGAPRAIVAAGDGVVSFAGSMCGYGKTLIIRHNRHTETRYGHLSSIAPGIGKGKQVRLGDKIGRTGDTGNATAIHLHYEIRHRGRALDPITAGN